MSGEMIELVPKLWVRPEQVAAVWQQDNTRLRVVFVGSGDSGTSFYNRHETPIEEIAAKLNPPTWEQPPHNDDNDTVEIRDMSGVVMYANTSGAPRTGYEPDPPPEQVGAKGPTGAKGPPGVALYADTTAPRGGLRWHDLKREE